MSDEIWKHKTSCTNLHGAKNALKTGGLLLGLLLTGTSQAQDVTFSTVDPGQTKAITEWGIEVVQGGKAENTARLYRGILGEDSIDVLWSFFEPGIALNGSGNLVQAHEDIADGFIDGNWSTTLFPNAAWGFGPNIGGTDPYFFDGSSLDTNKWYNLVKKHVEYYQSRGQTVAYMMPFNEPYYWAGQGPAGEVPAALNSIAQLLADDATLDGIGIMGPSTLESAAALGTYDVAKGPLTHGSTHHLQWYNSASWIADFYTYVLSQGDVAYNPELHALGEAIFSAEYGCTGGAWWADPDRLLPRALFMESCQGSRLGYAENRGGDWAATLTQSAAAVYLSPGGELYGFAGGFERQTLDGSMNNYRFVCTDRDVYFNGIGPIREYVLPVRNAQDALVKIEYGTNIMPALDGHRWKIKNRLTGQVLEVAGGLSTDGADIQEATDANALRQKWDILLFKDGYYVIYNANSGKPMDNYGWSIGEGGNVAQWSDTGGLNQRWFIEPAGGGYYYIRNGHGTLYVDGNLGGASVKQYSLDGGQQQQWQFILADPAVSGTPTAHYEFESNANDSIGSNHGTASGSPAYTGGEIGQAIDLDGANDYVTLPSGIADVDDITVAAWVNWDGGGAQQRIFDFGDDTTNYFFLTPSDFNGQMHCSITTGSYQYEDALVTDGLPVGQWVHVAVTLRGNTGILYVDGLPKVAGYMSLNPSDFNPANNYIGKSQWPDPLFNGQIDDFRIYDYALTDSEIAAIALVTPPDTTPPAAPTALAATAADGTIALDWADNSDPDFESYTVYRSITSGSNYVAVDSGLTSSTNADDTVINGTTYYYVVSATDSNANESAYSSEVSVVPSPATFTPEESVIASHAVVGGTNLSVTVSNTVLGHWYAILTTETLMPPLWTTNAIEDGTGSNLIFGIPIDPASTNRFFKLMIGRQ